MTVDSTRIFGCPTCGFRISDNDVTCPRCGIRFSSETKFECPFCGELVDQGSAECPSCRVNYGDFKEKTESRGGDDSIDALLLEIIQLEAQSARTETRKFSCPGCSWMLDSGTERCPRCGRDLTAEEEAFQCPICGSAVSSDATSCPECGSSFEAEAEASGQAANPVQFGIAGTMEATDALMRFAESSSDAREAEPEPRAAPEAVPPTPAKTLEPEPPLPEPGPEVVDEERPMVVMEEPIPEAQVRHEPPQVVSPIKVMAKPAPRPKVVRPPEPKPEPTPSEPAPEEQEMPSEEPSAGQPKKAKQRKLKTKTPAKK
jgi:rubrerythrin